MVKQEDINEILDRLEMQYPDAECALHHENVFQLIVAVALSAQTTDKSVNQVTPALFRKYPDPASLAAADVSEVEACLKRIGMYRTKAKNIIGMAKVLTAEYDGLKEQKEKGSKAVKQENRDESRIRHILVVDDDPSYREVIERAFGAEYRIWERGDADSAVSLLMEQSDRVSIVILSMLLPENSSFEVLKLINENRKVWGIPVLATGTYNSALEKAALKFGADDYVGKSGDGYSLKRRMERIEGWITYRDRESQLLDEVFRDYLTGLLNRRGLHAAIKSLQQQDFPLAVYFFDLDDLKKINDQSGHETGDRVLRSFGRILRHYTRNTDILARYGGDEFVMILKNVPSKEFALKKGEDICRLFRDSQTEELTAASCSSGIVLCGGNEKLSPELFQRADRALYRAKAEHKGGCCLWRDVNE